MELWLSYGVYAAIAAVFVVLALGIVNLVRTDPKSASRSNKLMRLRVLIQFIAIILLVILGWMAGAFR